MIESPDDNSKVRTSDGDVEKTGEKPVVLAGRKKGHLLNRHRNYTKFIPTSRLVLGRNISVIAGKKLATESSASRPDSTAPPPSPPGGGDGNDGNGRGPGKSSMPPEELQLEELEELSRLEELEEGKEVVFEEAEESIEDDEQPDTNDRDSNSCVLSVTTVEVNRDAMDSSSTGINVEFPYKNREEMEGINRVREMLKDHHSIYQNVIRSSGYSSMLSDSNNALFKLERGVLRELGKLGLLAHQRYDDIHKSGAHNFSDIDKKRLSAFADYFIDRTGIGKDSNVLELGPGLGVESCAFAESDVGNLIAVDISETITNSMRENVENRGYSDKIHVVTGDYMEIINDILMRSSENPLTHIFANGSVHYRMPGMFRFDLLPKIRRLLQETDGYFGLAMKTSASDSARSSNQFVMTHREDDPFNISLDKEDRILRMYPNEDKIQELVESAGFRIQDIITLKEADYDKPGETEYLRALIARPK